MPAEITASRCVHSVSCEGAAKELRRSTGLLCTQQLTLLDSLLWPYSEDLLSSIWSNTLKIHGSRKIEMHVHCPTCLELFTPKDDLRCPPCGHVFHHECIQKWLRNKRGSAAGPDCPQCRKPHYALKGPNRVLESKNFLTPQFFPTKVPVLSMHYQK